MSLQQRLMALLGRLVAQLWGSLPGHDREHVSLWLANVVPLVTAATRQSGAITDNFLARSLDRAPLGVKVPYPRPVLPEVVYERPFVSYWTALKDGKEWEQAIFEGLDRATSAAETDVQLAMRQTLVDVGERDDLILGYRRVPNVGACDFCRLVAGQRYHTSQLMPIHNHCKCGVDVITAENRGDFGGKEALDRPHEGVAVHEHGELGPVLAAPSHHFTGPGQVTGVPHGNPPIERAA